MILRGLSFFPFLVFFLACFEKLTPRFSGFSGVITQPLLQYHTDNWWTMSRTKRQWADNRRQAVCLLTGKSMQIKGIKGLSISKLQRTRKCSRKSPDQWSHRSLLNTFSSLRLRTRFAILVLAFHRVSIENKSLFAYSCMHSFYLREGEMSVYILKLFRGTGKCLEESLIGVTDIKNIEKLQMNH